MALLFASGIKASCYATLHKSEEKIIKGNFGRTVRKGVGDSRRNGTEEPFDSVLFVRSGVFPEFPRRRRYRCARRTWMSRP